MATNEDRDELEDDELVEDDEIVDEADDEDAFDDEDEDEEDFEDEDDESDIETSATREVGSEGGSPGEAVESVSRRAGLGRGSEASETWKGGRDSEDVERRDDQGTLIKRVP